MENNVLRFNPIQISEWLGELLEQGLFRSQREMGREFGLHQSRIGQFLALKRLPEGERQRLKQVEDVREYHLREMTRA